MTGSNKWQMHVSGMQDARGLVQEYEEIVAKLSVIQQAIFDKLVKHQ